MMSKNSIYHEGPSGHGLSNFRRMTNLDIFVDSTYNIKCTHKMVIKDYYKGKNILVTGATGLMGKALVEKLLRSCPEVGNIYVIIRTKKSHDPKERWMQTTNSALFDQLKETKPECLSKVIVLPGEGTGDDFGLSDEHQKLIIDNVNIVYHAAASINFFDSITVAAKSNLKNTYSLLEISRKIKNLEIFVHVSTAFSNFPRTGEVKEEVYESHLSWRSIIKLIEDESASEVLLSLQPKLMGGHMTTYTLTKDMAEDMVHYYKKHFPIMIVRPSLVTGAYKDPLPGWFDVDNVISLFCHGVRLGVLRVILVDGSNEIIHVPLDLATRALIVAPWSKKYKTSLEDMEVVCCQMEDASKHQEKLTFNMVARVGMPYLLACPDKQTLWYPFFMFTRHLFIFHLLFIILHIVPAVFLDIALKCSGRNPIYLKVYSRLWALKDLSNYYVRPHNWFSTANYKLLEQSLLEEDREEFSMDTTHYNAEQLIRDNVISFIKYVWKDDPDKVKPEVRVRLQRFKIAHYTTCTITVIGLLYQFLKLLL